MPLEKILTKLQSTADVSIVALGDSLTSGWMVARGYTEFLRDMLMARYPTGRHQNYQQRHTRRYCPRRALPPAAGRPQLFT